MGVNGITIFTFTDPVSALEHFQINQDAYVLVISDFRMPGLNGMELLRKMKSMNKFVRTILMTGFDIDDSKFHDYTKKKIINAFIQKPVRIYDLIKEVDYILTKCKSVSLPHEHNQPYLFANCNKIRTSLSYPGLNPKVMETV